LSVIVWTDGEIGVDYPFESDGGGLNDGSLATMAKILGLNTTTRD
jgi:hypothetical protein